jgi:nucleoside-diphosphate-sugar epimerase
VYIIVGATQMLGAHLAYAMLKQGQRVRAVMCSKCDDKNFTKHILSYYSGDYENLFNEIEWVEACPLDLEAMTEAFQGGEAVFYCRKPFLSTKHSFDDNIEEIRNVITAIRENSVKYFYYISSLDVLGQEPDYKLITENSQRNPKAKYPTMTMLNYMCEMEVQRALNEDIEGAIANTGIILGPGDWKTDTSRLFPLTLTYNYYAKGVTGFVSVNDVVKSLMTMARKKITGERFILVSENLSYHQVLKLMTQKLNAPEPKKYANSFRMTIYKACYIGKSLLTGRRPILDNAYFNRMTSFEIFSNKKSIGTLIVNYEPIEQVIEETAQIYLKENSSEIKKTYKFARNFF